MNRTWKKYLVLLLVSAPIGGYAIWLGVDASQQQVVAPRSPPEIGGPGKDDLTQSHGKATSDAEDARLVATAALRFQPAGPKEPGDADAKAAVGAAAARAQELVHLRMFVEGRAKSEFRSRRWEALADEQETLKGQEGRIEARLADTPDVAGATAAKAQLDEVRKLIDTYAGNRLHDRMKVEKWQLRARARVVRGLDAWATKELGEVLKGPADPGAQKALLGAVEEIGKQADALGRELGPDHTGLDPRDRGAVDLPEAWAARKQLLEAFAGDPAGLPPEDIGGRLAKVRGAYTKLQKQPELRALIREKVQPFCGGFIPEKLRLDSVVRLDGEVVPRAPLNLEFEGEAKPKKLSADPLGDLTEFNHTKQSRKFNHIEWNFNQKVRLEPTDASKAAFAYSDARKSVPRWDGPSVIRLKEACKDHDETVLNKLTAYRTDQGPNRDLPAQAWTRLALLEKAIKDCPELFER